MNVSHVSASPVGMKVWCESTLLKAEGRNLIFSVKAYDEKGLIGEGEHHRVIISNERFQQKANSKLG